MTAMTEFLVRVRSEGEWVGVLTTHDARVARDEVLRREAQGATADALWLCEYGTWMPLDVSEVA